MNILAKPSNYNHIIPIIHVLISNKSYYSYIHIFNDIKLNIFLKGLKINQENIYFIYDFDKGLVKAIAEYFPKSKSIGCFYHYCKSLWVYAKKLQCFIKNNNREVFFFLFAYKIYPFIKDKDTYIQKIELMINNTNNNIRYLRIHKYFIKNWSKQKLLNYNEYFENKFYDATNNFSEAFNYSLHKLINMNHPKISILFQKLKSYIKLKTLDYYE